MNYTGVNEAAAAARERLEYEYDHVPSLGTCVYCGEPVRASTARWDGDEYVETDDGIVHWECWDEYGETLKKQG